MASSASLEGGTFPLCLEILQQECSPDELHQALNTLLTIMRNSQKSSQYCTLNTKNPKFLDRVWRFVGAQQFLQASGWTEVDESVILTDDQQIPDAIIWLETQLQKVTPTSSSNGPNAIIQNGSPLSDEEKKKRDLMEEERSRQLQQMKREKEERKRIASQIKADRDETKTREIKESKAKDLKFGSNVKRFGDIGVDLNRGGG